MVLNIFTYIIESIVRDPFTQITGFMAMGVILTAYFQKDDYTVKKLMILSTFFWGTHFYLLGMYSGLCAVIIFLIRLLLSMKYERNIKAFLLIIFITLVTGFFTYDGWITLLPVATSISGAYSFFFLEKIKLRIAMMANSLTWLVYHTYIGSISGMANEIFTQVILVMTIYRLMHPEGGTLYYANKIKEILWKTRHPDYDRYIFVQDKIMKYKNNLGQRFLHFLHLDLVRSIQKKKWTLCKRYLHFQKDQ